MLFPDRYILQGFFRPSETGRAAPGLQGGSLQAVGRWLLCPGLGEEWVWGLQAAGSKLAGRVGCLSGWPSGGPCTHSFWIEAHPELHPHSRVRAWAAPAGKVLPGSGSER